MPRRSACALVALSFVQLFSSVAFAQIADAISVGSLSGLKAFYVSIGDLNAEVRQAGLTAAQLRTDIELKFREAGIGIIPQPAWIDTIGGAELYVEANALKHGGGQYSYCIQISVIQKASLSTKPTHETLATTWSSSVMGVVGSTSAATKIRGEVGAETDRFVGGYLSANPPVGKRE